MLDALNALRQRMRVSTPRDVLPELRRPEGQPHLQDVRNGVMPAAAGTVTAPPDPLAAYLIPAREARTLQAMLRESRRALDPDYLLRGEQPERNAQALFYRTRTALMAAVRAMPVAAPADGITTPTLDGCQDQAAILRRLLTAGPGLIVADANVGRAGKQLLIQNMAVLRALGVDTLYLDQLQCDLHQAYLNTLHRTGTQPEALQHFMRGIDAAHMTDAQGGHTYAAVLDAASRTGLRVVALDQMTSYHLKGAADELDGPYETAADLRARVFSHVAAQRITHDQRGREHLPGVRRWVALLSNGCAGSTNGIAGVGPRLGIATLRVEDADPAENNSLRAGFDPGRSVPPGPLVNSGEMQCDYLLKVPMPGTCRLHSTPEPCSAGQAQAAHQRRAAIAGCRADLSRTGTYRLLQLDSGEQLLVHRSAARGLVAHRIVPTEAGGLRLQPTGEADSDSRSTPSREFRDLHDLRQSLAGRMEEVPRYTPA
ncbi:membrane-targeted effector domain-containing toxin [Stenotrophomonas sp. PS02289]|uniref:membrane-targeted effector domain-containing toxin n=1 Tax=Stenotrophomonas sp. PS02289 TaxID=2991422 RepID=UPI00249AC5EA|nr:membrane-targeted effector domain-containing toxin [Stenotrophomonas sp. PS02289]